MEGVRPPKDSVYAQRKATREAAAQDGGRPKRPVNAFGVLARHPDLTKAFLAFNRHLLYENTLSERSRELLVLRISWIRDSEYEWAQHVPVAEAVGLTPDDIRRVAAGPDDPVWGALDAALLRAVDELHHDAVLSPATWATLSAEFDERQLMDLIFTVGAYDTLAVAFNCFGLPLDPELEGQGFGDLRGPDADENVKGG